MLYKADIMADASAALGIIGRTGLGKLRHIDTSYLWLQQDSIKKKSKIHHFRLPIRRIPFWGPLRSFWAPFGCHLRSFGIHFNPQGRTSGSILAALARVGWPFARVEPNLSRFRMLLIAFWLHFRSLAYFFHTCKLLQLFCPGST